MSLRTGIMTCLVLCLVCILPSAVFGEKGKGHKPETPVQQEDKRNQDQSHKKTVNGHADKKAAGAVNQRTEKKHAGKKQTPPGQTKEKELPEQAKANDSPIAEQAKTKVDRHKPSPEPTGEAPAKQQENKTIHNEQEAASNPVVSVERKMPVPPDKLKRTRTILPKKTKTPLNSTEESDRGKLQVSASKAEAPEKPEPDGDPLPQPVKDGVVLTSVSQKSTNKQGHERAASDGHGIWLVGAMTTRQLSPELCHGVILSRDHMMRNQWMNAPPGQPPKSASLFL